MQAVLSLEGRPVRGLVHAAHAANEVHSPLLYRQGPIEAEGAHRDRELGDPGGVGHPRLERDDPLPRLDHGARVVEDLLVPNASHRIDREEEGVAAIVEGVEGEAEDVAVPGIEVALEAGADRARWLRIEVLRRDIELIGIVEDADLRAEGRGTPRVGELLPEVGEHLGRAPLRLIEHPVDAWGSRHSRGGHRGARRDLGVEVGVRRWWTRRHHVLGPERREGADHQDQREGTAKTRNHIAPTRTSADGLSRERDLAL